MTLQEIIDELRPIADKLEKEINNRTMDSAESAEILLAFGGLCLFMGVVDSFKKPETRRMMALYIHQEMEPLMMRMGIAATYQAAGMDVVVEQVPIMPKGKTRES